MSTLYFSTEDVNTTFFQLSMYLNLFLSVLRQQYNAHTQYMKGIDT